MKTIAKTKKPWFKKPSQEVSKRMQLVKSSNTMLEKKMEALLKSLGIKYQKQPPLFGRPDFRVENTNSLIFCDSSFWHGRRTREITGEAFKKNKAFWTNKLNENRKRDKRINQALRKEGWKVLRFWDTDILKFPEKVTENLNRELENEK